MTIPRARTAKPSQLHLAIRAAVIDAGLTLEENSDTTIKVALECVLSMALANRAREMADRCCNNCNCVALANILSELRPQSPYPPPIPEG